MDNSFEGSNSEIESSEKGATKLSAYSNNC